MAWTPIVRELVYLAITGQFLSGYFLFTVCFAIPGTFMTALCLCNNISRHIKITSMVLNL